MEKMEMWPSMFMHIVLANGDGIEVRCLVDTIIRDPILGKDGKPNYTVNHRLAVRFMGKVFEPLIKS